MLWNARRAKNDEFYTQYADIEREIGAYLEYDSDAFRGKTVLLPCDVPGKSNFTNYFALNFGRLGLKRLVSTSLSNKTDPGTLSKDPTLFGFEPEQERIVTSFPQGQIWEMEKPLADGAGLEAIDFSSGNLLGSGDFRSGELAELRNQADFVITNPPFSLFREFLDWLISGDVKFSIIGNMNAITYKEVFPLFKANKLWLGATGNDRDMVFEVPDGTPIATSDREKAAQLGYVGNFTRLGNSCWFTSIEHGVRHSFLELRTQEENLIDHQVVRRVGYREYDNYRAIDVPRTSAIPSDYRGIMGVPITFLVKYNPDQFEILGSQRWAKSPDLEEIYCGEKSAQTDMRTMVDGRETYDRIFIRNKAFC